jgi:hypothetical protein
VPDPQPHLALHLHVVGQQQVEVLQHRAGQAVFDGNDRGVDFFRGQRRKHVRRKRARNKNGVGDQLHRGLMAE